MYHSLTLGGKNTWDDWHLVPESRPVMNPPKPKFEYANIPGLDGALDFTEVFGDVLYENREGSWTFYVMNDYGQKNYDYNAWYELYRNIMGHLHGLYMLVYSEDDPEYIYRGRVSVNNWASEKDYSKITFDYNLEPYKYRAKRLPNGEMDIDDTISTARNDWKWDDLFDLTIKYGKFNVDGRKVRTLYNDLGRTIEPAIRCSSKMKVYSGRDEKDENLIAVLRAGRNYNSGITLEIGETELLFVGNGTVTVDYDKDGTVL